MCACELRRRGRWSAAKHDATALPSLLPLLTFVWQLASVQAAWLVSAALHPHAAPGWSALAAPEQPGHAAVVRLRRLLRDSAVRARASLASVGKVCLPLSWLRSVHRLLARAPLSRQPRTADTSRLAPQEHTRHEERVGCSPGCHAMLRFGHAPGACRALRLDDTSIKRRGVNACAAPAPAELSRPQSLGFRRGVQRHSLSAAAPRPALRARRGSVLDAARRVRCSAERAAQVRRALCFACSCACSRERLAAQASQAGASITVWVKRMDVAGAQYVEVENVDMEQMVSKFKARWMAQEKLGVPPSLVTLRLVKCGARKPTAKQEAKAKLLDDPRLTLSEAGITDGCSLLAFVAGACGTVCPPPAWQQALTRWPRVRVARNASPPTGRARAGQVGGASNEGAEGGVERRCSGEG